MSSESLRSKISPFLLNLFPQFSVLPFLIELGTDDFQNSLTRIKSLGINVRQIIPTFGFISGETSAETLLALLELQDVGYVHFDMPKVQFSDPLASVTDNFFTRILQRGPIPLPQFQLPSSPVNVNMSLPAPQSADSFINFFDQMALKPFSLLTDRAPPNPLTLLPLQLPDFANFNPFNFGNEQGFAEAEPVEALLQRFQTQELYSTFDTRRLIGADQAEQEGYAGQGVKSIVLDTGVAQHSQQIGQEVDFDNAIVGHPTVDENGHGCCSADTLVYTTYCGIERIGEMFNKINETRESINDGKVDIIDISDMNIETVGYDFENQITKKTKITHIHRIPIDEEVTEVIAGTSKFVTTNWHPFLVADYRYNKNKYVRADKLNNSVHHLVMPERIITHNQCFMDTKLAYLIGYFIGNGSFYNNNVHISIGKNKPDPMKALMDVFGYFSSYDLKNERIITKASFGHMLKTYDFIEGKKSELAYIPKQFLFADKNTLKGLLAGLIDSDGSFDKNRARMRYVTASEKLAKQLVTIISSWGIQTRFTSQDNRGGEHTLKNGYIVKNKHIIYTISVLGDHYYRLLKLVEPYLLYKQPQFQGSYRKNTNSWIKSTRQFHYKGYFYDFTTETENYIAGEQGVCFIHNTHVSSTVFGKATINHREIAVKGVAPECVKGAIKVLGGGIGTGKESDVIKGMELAYLKGAKVVNMSLGSQECNGTGIDPCLTCPECRVVQALTEKGMIFCIAAGNSGPKPQTIGCPGCAPFALTVGAIHPKTGEIANFSSRGPRYGRIKPDIVSPGINIYSATSLGSLLDSTGDKMMDGYAIMSGTCLTADSLVYTNPSEPIEINKIKIGTLVYSFNEKTKKIVSNRVTNILSNGIKSVFKLKLGGKTLRLTTNHPLLTLEKRTVDKSLMERQSSTCKFFSKEENSLLKGLYVNTPKDDLLEAFPDRSWNSLRNRASKLGIKRKNINQKYHYKLVWKNLEDLKIDDIIVSIKKLPDCNNNNFTKEFCRLFGFLIGDGWVSPNKTGYMICFAKGVDETRNKFYVDLFKRELNLEMRLYTKGGWYYTYSKEIGQKLRNLGLDKHAKTKIINDWLFKESDENKHAFIIGLIDADGCRRKERITLELSSKKLVEQIHELCIQLGIRVSNIRYRKRIVQAPNSKTPTLSESWSISMGLTEIKGKMMTIHSDIIAKQLLDPEHYQFERIRSIEPDGEEEVFDLTIENNHNFIANGIVVHNSMATPHVAGLVTLLAQKYPELTTDIIKQVAQAKGIPKDNNFGWGLLHWNWF